MCKNGEGERGKCFTLRFVKKTSSLKAKSHNTVKKKKKKVLPIGMDLIKAGKKHLSKELFREKTPTSPRLHPTGAHLGKGFYLSSWDTDPKPLCPEQDV